MAKKTWTYVKNEQGEYILSQYDLSRLRTFYIWEVLKLRQNSPEEYKKLTFYSTQTNPSNRVRMTPVKNGFFRYIENIKGGNNSEGDNESISHSMAILVLSEIENIKFVVGKKTYHLNFSKFIIEPRLQFENGNVYYPDLIGYFSSDCDLSEKWSGKVAIEVAVKHKCEPLKIKDFLEHNIPIIEVSITPKLWFSKEFNKTVYDSDDVEKYYNFLKDRFMNQVFGNIRSDPVSVIYFKNKLTVNDDRLRESLNKFSQLKTLYQTKLTEIATNNKNLMHKLDCANLEKQQLSQSLVEGYKLETELRNKINEFESMRFWKKFKYLLSN